VPAFELPDTTTSLPIAVFEFSPAARQEAAQILAGGPQAAFQRLLRDQESEASMLVARRVLDAFFSRAGAAGSPVPPGGGAAATPVAAGHRILADTDPEPDADTIVGHVLAVRADLTAHLAGLIRDDAEVRDAVLRQRAPLSLLAGCWLDTVSQPATQPAVAVNRLFGQRFLLQGEGSPQRSSYQVRRRVLEQAGVFLPEIDSADFGRKAQIRPLTALHVLFYLALSRLSASFLPEATGVHYAFYLLAVDDLLLGTAPVLSESVLRDGLAEYLALTRSSVSGPADRHRLRAAIGLTLSLESEYVGLLADLAAWQRELSLEGKAAAIIERHAPYAGRQHRVARVGGRLLTEIFGDPGFDLADFVRVFRDSRQLKPIRGGDCRFLRAIKFGGPMFGIFDDREAAVFKAWAQAAAVGELPAEVELSPNRAGDEAASGWLAAIEQREPADVRYAEARPGDDRALLHRLVNIERFASTLPLARQCALDNFQAAEVLFSIGSAGRYTDASFFDYTPEALLERVEQIYWSRLVNPYRPLAEIPSRDEVIFGQKTFALGSLIDGAWAYRIGGLGRYRRASDGILASIYADEMGRGDIRKNHITIICQVLASMGIHLPHIRDMAFLDQDELPDHLYGFSIHQICMALFPDSFYNEILGYNLGIEMFGLGEMRLHEMQKLRHHGFDPAYEQAHLSIDNLSSGHARQSAEIIISYLDDVARTVGSGAVPAEWRRIWRGYASFAYFIEHALVRHAAARRDAELVI
jgi:hypothetical protein